jgi:hypothetical protein
MPPAANAPHDPAGSGWLDGLLVLGVLGLAGLLGCAVVRNSDLWLHLATGRAIAAGESQVGVDPFGSATAGTYWANRSWLADLGLYHVYNRFGGPGVAFTRSAIALALAGVLLTIRRPGSGLALPAVGAALALVAANAQLVAVRPMLVSFLLLAVLVCLLQWPARSRGVKPLAVALVCAAWANLDQWFVLGPAVIALWFVGSLLQPRGEADGPGAVAVLLAVALAACLANPHHVRAFTWPDELVPGSWAEPLRSDPSFSGYQAGVFEWAVPPGGGAARSYGTRVGAAPAWALLILMALGVASIALNLPNRPWRRVLVILGLGALASWRGRLAPFFAVGATPLIVLNFQDWLAGQDLGRPGRLVGHALRGLAAVGVLGLCAAAWPGWLGPFYYDPHQAYRVNPRLEADPSSEALAKQIGAWYADGKLSASDRPFSPGLALNHLLNWYAPAAKTLGDVRWGLHGERLADWLAARKELDAMSEGRPADRAKLAEVFRKHGVTFLALSGTERGRSAGPAWFFWTDPEGTPWWAVFGRATAFGWSGAHPDLRMNLGRRAFAAHDGPTVPPTPADPVPPTAWDLYRTGPPARPLALDESAVWLDFCNILEALLQTRRVATAAGQFAGQILTAASRSGLAPFEILAPVPQNLGGPLVRATEGADAISAGVLAVRAARTATAALPLEPRPYFNLAEANRRFFGVPSLGELQYATALTQAQARFNARTGRTTDAAIGFHIAEALTRFHAEKRHIDLAVAAAEEGLRLMPSVPELQTSPQRFEREYTAASQRLDGYKAQLKTLRDQFELQAEGKPLPVRVALAYQSGLPGEALNDIRREVQAGDRERLGGLDPRLIIDLMLRVGQAEEARQVLENLPREPGEAPPANLRELQLRTDAALGDAAAARANLKAIADQLAAERTTSAARTAAGLLALAPDSALGVVVPGRMAIELQARFGGVLFQNHVWSGLLALQQGDTRSAAAEFDAARQAIPPGMRADNQEVADVYRRLLERAGG